MRHIKKRVGSPIDPIILKALWDLILVRPTIAQIRSWLQRKKLSHLAWDAQQMLNLKLRVVKVASKNSWTETHEDDLRLLVAEDELEDLYVTLLRVNQTSEGVNTFVKMVC